MLSCEWLSGQPISDPIKTSVSSSKLCPGKGHDLRLPLSGARLDDQVTERFQVRAIDDGQN